MIGIRPKQPLPLRLKATASRVGDIMYTWMYTSAHANMGVDVCIYIICTYICTSLDSYPYHFDAYFIYLILQSYWKYGSIILVILEALAVVGLFGGPRLILKVQINLLYGL